MNKEETEKARAHAVELFLCGVLASRDGDAERVAGLIDSSLPRLSMTHEFIAGVKQKNGAMVWDFLARLGVTQINDERAVDAVLRCYLRNRKHELEKLLKDVDESIRNEDARAIDQQSLKQQNQNLKEKQNV